MVLFLLCKEIQIFYDYAVYMYVRSVFFVFMCDSFPKDSIFWWLVFSEFHREMCFKNANCFQEKEGC